MKNDGNNKVFMAVIAVLGVIIIAMAVVIGVFLLNDSYENRTSTDSTVIETDMQGTTGDEVATSKQAASNFDISMFSTGIYTVDGQPEMNIVEEGGVSLQILDISENKVSFSYTVISAPPANRIANIEVYDAEISEGMAKFTFDDDCWFNRGKGTIKFTTDGKIKIRTDITRRDSEAMWEIGEQQYTLILSN